MPSNLRYEPQPLCWPSVVRVTCGAAELSLGDEVFRTDSSEKKKEFLKQEREQVVINPGQFALLLTKESVHRRQQLASTRRIP